MFTSGISSINNKYLWRFLGYFLIHIQTCCILYDLVNCSRWNIRWSAPVCSIIRWSCRRQRKYMVFSQMMWNLFMSERIHKMGVLARSTFLILYFWFHYSNFKLVLSRPYASSFAISRSWGKNNYSFWQIHKYNSNKARIIKILLLAAI